MAPTSDILAISVYYIAVINCFSLSTGFHIFSNHSKAVHKFGNELDHLGVVLVIYGSAIPATYFQFYCDPFTRNTYWALSTAFAAASAIFTLQPKFRQPAYRSTRFYMYSLLGLSCFIPIVYGIYAIGYDALDRTMSVSHFFGLGIVQFTGAAIYTARVPERFFPYTFDIFGNSHQIMHVLVIFGALTFEKGLLKALLRWNDGLNSCSTWEHIGLLHVEFARCAQISLPTLGKKSSFLAANVRSSGLSKIVYAYSEVYNGTS